MWVYLAIVKHPWLSGDEAEIVGLYTYEIDAIRALAKQEPHSYPDCYICPYSTSLEQQLTPQPVPISQLQEARSRYNTSMKTYLVGGSVRDYLLGVKSKDQDYMVEGSFEELKAFVLNLGYVILHEKPEFLTLRVKIPNGSVIDFACCRTEGEYDGRRPGVVEVTNLENDLSRRDFTVNAMAWEVDPVTFEPIGEIIDLFGGKADLENRTLRFVGDPYKRLEEDGLRWLRALRFEVTKGVSPDMPTLHITRNPPENVLDKVSIERVREELDKCFKYDTLTTMKVLLQVNKPIWLQEGLWLCPTLKHKPTYSAASRSPMTPTTITDLQTPATGLIG